MLSKTGEWFAKECRDFHSWLLVIAFVNWVYISHLAHDCRGIAPMDWYCSMPESFNVLFRLLIATLCLRSHMIWLAAIGFLLSAQIIAGQLFYLFNSDEILLRFYEAREYGGSFLGAVIRHEHMQGVIAAVIAFSAMRQIMRRLSGNRLYPAIVYSIRAFIVFLVIGYLSSFISHASAEKATAQWLYHDVLKGSSFYGDFLGDDFHAHVKESAERFASAGIKVMKVKPGELSDANPWAKVGPSAFTGPFLITVQYEFRTGEKRRYGNCLVFDFFGFIKILDRDSRIGWDLVRYLHPY